MVLFLLCYFVDNLPYSFVGDATLGQHFEQLKQYFQSPKEDIPEDLLLVNVAYDRDYQKEISTSLTEKSFMIF